MSYRSSGGRAFHTLGPAAEKLLWPKLLWVHGTAQVLSLADRSRRRPLSMASWMSSARYWGACPDSDCTSNSRVWSGFAGALAQCLKPLLAKLVDKMRSGFPDLRLKLGWGGFRLCEAVSRKRCEIELKWQLITNRKSYVGFRLQRKSMTLNDHEWPWTSIYCWHRVGLFGSTVIELYIFD